MKGAQGERRGMAGQPGWGGGEELRGVVASNENERCNRDVNDVHRLRALRMTAPNLYHGCFW